MKFGFEYESERFVGRRSGGLCCYMVLGRCWGEWRTRKWDFRIGMVLSWGIRRFGETSI